ncbi:MAG TPA: BTAD domain-containing putative transcriptional regulator, partial [Marmoricola sp.]|nr:BTAD domain-containing putative transcriptional regulator [Marmoricola sp.]
MLKICLLGERAIVDTGTGEVLVRSPRALALVAFLAAHAPTPQSRTRIAAAFWPESGEQQALTNLRRELHQLRQVPGIGDSLQVTSGDLAWVDDPGCRVDLRVFRTELARAREAGSAPLRLAAARAALEAYAGDLLPGVYDDATLALRELLDRECADLCDLLVEAATDAGDPASALTAARRRVELQPLEETGYRTLIGLQARLGDRAGAVSTYHHCATVLERELGLQPDLSTRAVLDAALRRSDAAGSSTASSDGPAVLRRHVAPAPDLVGRREQFAVLQG